MTAPALPPMVRSRLVPYEAYRVTGGVRERRSCGVVYVVVNSVVKPAAGNGHVPASSGNGHAGGAAAVSATAGGGKG